MASILDRIFGRKGRGSGATAKDRLRFVLQHDRINLPPERMEQMKRDILSVIVKYVVVDKEHVEIDLQQLDRSHSKIVAEIPFVKQTVPHTPEDDVKPGDAASDLSRENGGKPAADESGDDDSEPAKATKDQDISASEGASEKDGEDKASA